MREKVMALIRKYREDKMFRAELMLYVNSALNFIFAAFYEICGFVLHSVWTGTLAFYYIVLSLMRFFILLRHRNADCRSKWKAYRACGTVLLAFTIVLIGMYILTTWGGHEITYPWYFIYAIAAYTFYTVIAAVRNVVIYHKLNDPILSASKEINLAAAAISIYSLQSAMITAFGDGDSAFRIVMGNCVCSGVFAFIVCLSVIMIARANKNIR